MDKLFKWFLAIGMLLLQVPAIASIPILDIVPNAGAVTAATTITLAKTGQATIPYTVTNNANKTVSNLTFYPAFGVDKNAASAIQIQNNNCTGSLVSHASCTFDILLTGNSMLPASFVVSPKVCIANNAACSQPISANRVMVNVTAAAPQFAYIGSSTSNSVFSCSISANGDIDSSTCVETTGFNVPFGISFNPAQTLAYVANEGGTNISKCSFASDNSLTNCQSTGSFTEPANVAINPANTSIAYVGTFDFLNPRVFKCTIIANGDLTACTSTGSSILFPNTITLNASGTVAYITNNSGATVCQIANNGDLTGCGFQDAGGIIFARNLAINPAGTLAYITGISPLVTKCTITSGNLTACASTSDIVTSGFAEFIAINASETLAYVSTSNPSQLFKCAINANGELTNCAATANGMNIDGGIALK